MRSVNVTELRSRLSAYLGRVRGGEEILIRDRNLAIAKIVPLSKTDDFDEEMLELAAQGQVRLSETSLDLHSARATSVLPIARNDSGALAAERAACISDELVCSW